MAHDPDRSMSWGSPFGARQTSLMNLSSARANPLARASWGFHGKLSSLTTKWCKLSRRNSAQRCPPWPSYTPKKEHLGQFSCYLCSGFTILRMIETLSSLYPLTSPWLVLAAYDFIMPHFFWLAFVGSWFFKVIVFGFKTTGLSPNSKV
jgi:hypothetical protein